jgi:hypothetical protein
MVAGFCAMLTGQASADNRVSASKKGSLLMFSKVELEWVCREAEGGFRCDLSQDTFLDMSNDYPDEVDVQMYFLNGDEPLEAVYVGDSDELLERAHPGWNWVDCQITLTQNQPVYWSAFSGDPVGCQPFSVLDPPGRDGEGRPLPPGRPDPAGRPGVRVLRGMVYAWAVKPTGEEIRWNHLSGDATIVNYADGSAWEYNAYAAQACPGDTCNHGDEPDATPGELSLDGVEYDIAFERLLLDFYAAGSFAFSNRDALCSVELDTYLTLHPVSQDFRQDNEGPIYTKIQADIWDENEIRQSATERCIVCWDQTLLSQWTGVEGLENNFLIDNLGTDKGKARLNGDGSTQCPFSVDAAILGVAHKVLYFSCATGADIATAGRTLVGMGQEAAQIQYDIIEGPDQAQQGTGLIQGGSLRKGEGRIGR